MKKLPFLSQYALWLTVVLGIAFSIHSWLRGQRELAPFGDLLVASYLLNMVLALGIVWGLFAFRRKLRNLIGFLFIGGSLLKFLVFFLFFYPEFRTDGTIVRAEFLSFFIPYLLSLVLETVFASRMLRDLEKEDAR